MAVLLRCTACQAATVSALFYRGPGHHVCHACGEPLTLANEEDERRGNVDRRAGQDGHWDDMRSGVDRRDPPPAA